MHSQTRNALFSLSLSLFGDSKVGPGELGKRLESKDLEKED